MTPLLVTRLAGVVDVSQLAADVRVVEPEATLRFDELPPAALVDLVDAEVAERWLSADVAVGAEEAVAAGFAVYGPAEALETAIAAASPAAVLAVRRLVAAARGRTLDEVLDLEERAFAACLEHGDGARRIARWVDGRAGRDDSPGPDIAVERRGALLVATLSRPARRNALREQTFHELATLLAGLAAGGAQGMILTARGPVFCAGEDLRELAMAPAAQASRMLPAVQELTRLIVRSPRPVVAALQGPAVGVGAELALACHAAVAAPGATLSFPEAQLGLLPTNGAFAFVPRRAGAMRALVWFLTGWAVSAEEAARLGLLTRVVPEDQLLATAAELAEPAP